MFEHLKLQIMHQYGKYLNFNEAANGNNDPIMGIRKGYFEDETIVQLEPAKDRYGSAAYKIKHQYGKYLNFNEAANGNNDPIMGIRDSYSVFFMNKGCFEDETIVYLIQAKDKEGNNAYRIKHQYGKYLNFNEAKNGNNDPVMGIRESYTVFGMKKGCFEDETIVRLIPINFKFVIKLEDFVYDEPRVQGVTDRVQVSTTFENDTNAVQLQDTSETVKLNKTINFTHNASSVQKWLNKISGEIELSAIGKVVQPLHSADIHFGYTWNKKTVSRFRETIIENSSKEVTVTNKLTIEPHTTVICDYVSSQLHSTVPYTAQMKISCVVGGEYVSSGEDMKFILYNTGNYPADGTMRVINGRAVYCTELAGEITPTLDLNCTTRVRNMRK